MRIDPAALERIEIGAMADFYRAAPPALYAAHAVGVRTIAGAHCFICRGFNPTLIFRRAVGLGVDRPAARADLDAVCGFMDAQEQPYSVHVNPHARPAALTAWLEERGFRRGYAWMKFARACGDPLDAPTDFDIRLVDRTHSDAFGQVVTEGFSFLPAFAPWVAALPGRPRWICAMAFDGGTPVAAGAGYVEDGHAWFGLAATLPAARRSGAQRALLALRLREAAARGASVAAIETGERVPYKPSNSYRNILRAGFKEIYLRPNYLAPTPPR